MRENCTYGSMRGRAYPTRGVPLYSTPFSAPSYECPLCDLDCDEYPIWNRNVKDLKIERLSKEW